MTSLIQEDGIGVFFRFFITHPKTGTTKEITFFRDAPTRLISASFTDPFGPAAAEIELPAVTSMDKPGDGDLDWMVEGSNVDIRMFNQDNQWTGWVWEGYYVTDNPKSIGTTLTLKGALYQADNFVAAPWFPSNPVPYELLIQRTLDPSRNPTLRTGPVQVKFPDGWKTIVPNSTQPSYMWFLRPWGVRPGQKWTGLTTRNTGGWEPKLTGFVQGLLGVMHTEQGQWTVSLLPGRKPVLHVREHIIDPKKAVAQVFNGAPGVTVGLSRDHSQTTNVVYGQGTDLMGTAFSGQQVSPDGQTTTYTPLAALPQVHPASSANTRRDTSVMRKESRLSFPQGLSEAAARSVSTNQVRRFADPGWTGTITMETDPYSTKDVPMSRYTVRAGDSIVLKNFRGEDLLLHVSQTEISEEGTVTWTVDSKYRDALTVDEVMARSRDALNPVHLLKVGAFSVTTQDLVKPWSYSEGSGIVPSGGGFDATPLFTKLMPPSAVFPWTDYTRKYPPKKYPHFYIRFDPKNSVATKNWAGLRKSGTYLHAFPIKMAQAGTIRLTQFAMYDENGNVIPANFHVSIYTNSGVNVGDMPMIPKTGYTGAGSYKASERFPFFKGAFERMNEDGTETTNPGQIFPENAGLAAGWGNYYNRAGYWPGNPSTGKPTGMMVDETQWSFDTSSNPDFDPHSAANTAKSPTAGMMYLMVYCDTHGNKPAYMLGRFFRVEPTG